VFAKDRATNPRAAIGRAIALAALHRPTADVNGACQAGLPGCAALCMAAQKPQMLELARLQAD